MKKLITLVLCLGLLASLFAGCSDTNGGGGGGSDAAIPEIDPSADFSGRTLDILLNVGGGGDYYQPVIDRMKADLKGLTINYTYDLSAPDIMRQRTLSGNPPDIFNLNAGMYDYYGAISEGVCAPLDPYLELSTFDGSGKLKDVVDTSVMVRGMVDGKHYIWPEVMFTSGLWYDANLLKEKGINPPTTWDEFLAAGEKLDKDGIDLLGYCGMMANEYAMDYLFYPLLITRDYDTFVKVQNMEDGAWDTDGMKDLVAKLQELRDKGYVDTATIALGNNETQMEHIAHKFAFLPCGSWLEAEMADAWTSDWEVTYLPFSGKDSGGSDYIHMVPLSSCISSKTENQDLVGAFYRYLYSDPKTVEGVVGVAQNGLPIKDFGKNYGSMLNKSTSETWTAIDSGSKSFVSLTSVWYNEFPKTFADAFNAFMGGQIDGDEFRQRMSDASKKIVEDSEITKYTYGE